MASKKEKLLGFLSSTIDDDRYKDQFQNILDTLHLSKQKITDAFLHYNLDMSDKEGNEVYRPLPNRVVLHIHNLINESWHLDRQQTVLDLIKQAKPNSIIDIGFGVPSKYVQNYVIAQRKKLVFCDLYDSAFDFTKALMPHWDNNWQDIISFKQINMDTLEYVGDFDLYLIQDAIEHTKDPTAYLSMLVNKSPKTAKFIVSLPIGPIFPRHFMAWHNDQEALDWLEKCGLSIEQQKSVFVKPEVDLFADQLAPDYHDLYILGSKCTG
jgi:hypothetical protein